MLIRLNKFLAESGCCSRRKADEYIEAGDVSVNGKVVKELGIKVNQESDEIRFRGKIVKPNSNFVYYALYKPSGVVSTVSDELGRKSVVDLVPNEPRVYPVGRLDADSEGLIILTNDGDLTLKLTHPSFEHEKEYEVLVKSRESSVRGNEIVNKFTEGILVDKTVMKANRVKVSINSLTPKLLTLYLVLHTGYNRQIRKMCDKIGLTVKRLLRVRLGKLELKSLDLSPGEYKLVKKEDII